MRNFTPLGITAIILLMLIGLTGWFAFMISASTIKTSGVRAITRAEHVSCMDMPRGNDRNENDRQNCWDELYGSASYKQTWLGSAK